jgi:hypothetical protein
MKHLIVVLAVALLAPWGNAQNAAQSRGADQNRRTVAAQLPREVPAKSPAVRVPTHNEAALQSAKWWLDRAEAECIAVKDVQQRGLFASLIMVGRANLNDDAGEQRMLRLAQAAFPPAVANDWTPLAEPRRRAVLFHVRRLVSAGRIDEATTLAAEDQQSIAEVAKSVARSGKVEQSLPIFERVDKDLRGRAMNSGVWLLLCDEKVDAAESLALHVEERWAASAYGLIAAYRARHADIDGVLKDFDKIPKDELGSDRVTASAKIVGAFAQSKNAGAKRFIESLPAADQSRAYGWLVEGQLKRDDVEAARATLEQVSGNESYRLKEPLAEALVRTGQTKEAIDLAVKNPHEVNLPNIVVGAAIRYRKLDAAAEMIKRLPAPSYRGEQPNGYREGFVAALAAAYAREGQIGEAQKLLAGAADNPFLRWAIAAAQRRAGNVAAYEAVRKPLADAVKNAAGAPSRQDALGRLLSFDVNTDNFQAAERDLDECDAEMLRVADDIFFAALDGDARLNSKPDLGGSGGRGRVIWSVHRPARN